MPLKRSSEKGTVVRKSPVRGRQKSQAVGEEPQSPGLAPLRHGPPLRFQEVLNRLVADESAKGTLLQVIARKAGITPGRLTLLRRKEPQNPALSTLIGLANALDVGLDELLFGASLGAVRTQVMPDMFKIADNLRRRDRMTEAVCQAIAKSIAGQIVTVAREVGEELASKPGSPVSAAFGTISIEDSMFLESTTEEECAVHAKRPEVRYWLESAQKAGGVEVVVNERTNPWATRFAGAVLQQLMAGKKYRWLYPAQYGPLEALLGDLEKLIGLVSRKPDITFRLTEFVTVGMSLRRINTSVARSKHPELLQLLESRYMDADGWVGVILPPADDCDHNLLMETGKLKLAKEGFEALWERAGRRR